ncbi:MAG: hypothetical protein J0L92_02945 [Deltaproteobacteria bacterium]|nr:hypothetical protein [Deltaproteobacteria bacterium]
MKVVPKTGRARAAVSSVVIVTACTTSLVGCGDAGPAFVIEPTESVLGQPTSRVAPAIRTSDLTVPAADPQLPGFDGWPLVFEAQITDPAQRCRAQITRSTAAVATLVGTIEGTTCTVLWDGRGAGGTRVMPGTLEVEGQILDVAGTVLARAPDRVEVVRVGIDRIDLSGETGARQPLLYRAMNGRRDGWFEMPVDFTPFAMGPDDGETASSALELPGGATRTIPGPWADLTSPPLEGAVAEDDVYNLPTAWIAGSRIDYDVHLTSDLAGMEAGGSPTTMEVRIAPPSGLTITGDATFRDDATVRMSGTPVTAVDRYDVAHAFTFEARRPGGEWQPMPGAFSITLRMYGLVAAPVFARTSIPHRAWVDVVDRITGWVDGASSDQDGVGAAIVDGVYNHSDLRYDTRAGASHYSDYLSGWGGGSFEMQAFEERRYGPVINCSDAASIVSAYANMIGLDFRYRILTHRTDSGFLLNYLQGIGSDAFRFSPFDSGRNSFRYHAIVNSRDARTWDATLAVDGDGTPSSSPFTQLLVEGLDPMAYLTALSPEAAEIATQMDDNVRIQ